MAWGKKKQPEGESPLAEAAPENVAEADAGLGFLGSEEFADIAEPIEEAPPVEWPEPAVTAPAFPERFAPGEASIGRSLAVTGELSGDEDVTIDGRVEGKITVHGHRVTIGENGNISAEIRARAVVVHGEVAGDIRADERVELRATASLNGDIKAPKVVLAEGARFSGKVDMRGDAAASEPAPAKAKKKAKGGARSPAAKAPAATDPAGKDPAQKSDSEPAFGSLAEVLGSVEKDEARPESE